MLAFAPACAVISIASVRLKRSICGGEGPLAGRECGERDHLAVVAASYGGTAGGACRYYFVLLLNWCWNCLLLVVVDFTYHRPTSDGIIRYGASACAQTFWIRPVST